jgi:hypothetical protein
VNAYFDALTNLFLKNSYPSDAIFNVDKCGFALGSRYYFTLEGTYKKRGYQGVQED